jgi:DNA topoisomerase III
VTDCRDFAESATFTWARNRLFDRACCLVLYDLVIEQSPIRAVVTSVRAEQRRKLYAATAPAPLPLWRPLSSDVPVSVRCACSKPYPLATVELQRRITRIHRITSTRVMDIAEQLYQKGYISYPRTETEKFNKEADLRSLIQAQTESKTWGGYAQGLLDGGFEQPREGKNDDKAHPPIHPIKFTDDLKGTRRPPSPCTAA